MTSAPRARPSPALYRTLGAFRGALGHFTQQHQRLIERAATLTPQQFSALVLLGGADTGGLSVGELAEALHIAHNSAVGLIQRAEQAGLIVRSADPERGQRTLLALTPEGRARLEAATEAVMHELADERQALVETLARWNAALHARQGTPWGVTPQHTLRAARPEERPLLWQLLQLHLHEGSAYGGGVPDERGAYPYPDFETYWHGAARRAYLLQLGPRPAAFALVRRHSGAGGPWHEISELHVLRQYRGQRLGSALVSGLRRRQPGRWSGLCQEANALGLLFWRAALRGGGGEAPHEERLAGDPPLRRFTLDADRREEEDRA